MPFCASSEGSGESAHLHRLTLAFVHCTKSLCAVLNGDLCAIHASSEYSGESAHLRKQSLDNVINIKISCAGSKGSWKFAQARLSLLYSIEISCAG